MHSVEVVDGAFGSPGREVGFCTNVANAIAIAFPTLEDIGMVDGEPAEVGCVASVISVGIGGPFVGIEAVEAMAVFHFPHVTGDVEFAEEGSVVSGFAQVIGKEDFVLRQDVMQAVDAVARKVFTSPEAGATGGADGVVDVTDLLLAIANWG